LGLNSNHSTNNGLSFAKCDECDELLDLRLTIGAGVSTTAGCCHSGFARAAGAAATTATAVVWAKVIGG
jgi:hypothetical protein